jgi:hypothetical protein
MVPLRIEIGAELTTLIIKFGVTISFVSICLDLLEYHSSIFYIIQKCGLLENSIHMCVEEQVAMFLHAIGH